MLWDDRSGHSGGVIVKLVGLSFKYILLGSYICPMCTGGTETAVKTSVGVITIWIRN